MGSTSSMEGKSADGQLFPRDFSEKRETSDDERGELSKKRKGLSPTDSPSRDVQGDDNGSDGAGPHENRDAVDDSDHDQKPPALAAGQERPRVADQHGLPDSGTASAPNSEPTFRETVSTIIPWIHGDDEVEIVDLIQDGRQTVHLARWRGKDVAVKAFDQFKDYHKFERQVRAYEELRDVWGTLVPEPYFVAVYQGVAMLLGMQLGRRPSSSDEASLTSERDPLFRRLRHEFGNEYRHGSVIYIQAPSGNERLVAIGLESDNVEMDGSYDSSY